MHKILNPPKRTFTEIYKMQKQNSYIHFIWKLTNIPIDTGSCYLSVIRVKKLYLVFKNIFRIYLTN